MSKKLLHVGILSLALFGCDAFPDSSVSPEKRPAVNKGGATLSIDDPISKTLEGELQVSVRASGSLVSEDIYVKNTISGVIQSAGSLTQSQVNNNEDCGAQDYNWITTVRATNDGNCEMLPWDHIREDKTYLMYVSASDALAIRWNSYGSNPDIFIDYHDGVWNSSGATVLGAANLLHPSNSSLNTHLHVWTGLTDGASGEVKNHATDDHPQSGSWWSGIETSERPSGVSAIKVWTFDGTVIEKEATSWSAWVSSGNYSTANVLNDGTTSWSLSWGAEVEYFPSTVVGVPIAVYGTSSGTTITVQGWRYMS